MRIRSPRVTDLQGLLQFRTSAFASVWSVWRPDSRRDVDSSSGIRHESIASFSRASDDVANL